MCVNGCALCTSSLNNDITEKNLSWKYVGPSAHVPSGFIDVEKLESVLDGELNKLKRKLVK